MKLLRSKKVQNKNGRKKNKYHITIEVTDYDIEMFEEFGWYPTAVVQHGLPHKAYDKMNRYLYNVFRNVFHAMWRKYD